MNATTISPEAREKISDADVTTIIGLEVHVQLDTESKLFCGCSTAYGADPNTQTCPVCTGQPGTLPVINETALKLAIKTGLALNCEIAGSTKWDRKNYFYPDLPKGYQISQFDKPICGEGHLRISDPKGAFDTRDIALERAHLEEDAGKSVHDESGRGADSKIDLNRTGTPLLEIVTKPDMRSAEEAKAFLTELKLILTYIGVSDCNMQEGSLRCDANVNLHIKIDGETVATPIVEVKNLNSFRAAERAINSEAARQLRRWKKDGLLIGQAPKQTRGWDDDQQKTTPQREKEESADYRYFPDPDLIAVETSAQEIQAIRETLGDLPADLRTLLSNQYGLDDYDTEVIVSQGRAVVDFFRSVADIASESDADKGGKLASNWVGQEVLRYLNENDCSIADYPISADQLGALLAKIAAGDFDNSRGKDVLAEMISSGKDLDAAVDKLGIKAVDSSEIDALCQQLIDENPNVVAQLLEGKDKAVGALIGKAKKLNPNVSPGVVKEKILKMIRS
jgi:aspartyl-tRNA(Asn)/glutamyl-tRNA(Gln) amidotransferase subunit B